MSAWFAINLAIAAALCFHVGFFSMDIDLPVKTDLDIAQHLLVVKTIIANGSPFPYENANAAYPGGGRWFDFPIPFVLNYSWIRLIAFLNDDAIVVQNLYAASGLVFSYLFSVAALRLVGMSRIVAIGCALVYATGAFVMRRMFLHIDYVMLAAPPLGCAAALALPLLARAPGAFRFRRFAPFGLGALVAGLNGVYYAFFSVMLIGAATAGTAIAAKSRRAIVIGAALCVVILVALGLSLLPAVLGAGMGAPARGAGEQALYALRVPDLILSPTLTPARILDAYREVRSDTEGADAFLGPIGVIALLAMLISRFSDAFGRGPWRGTRRGSMMRAAAASTILLLLFALPHGFGFLFNLIIDPSIRAQNRVSVFIAFLCLVFAGFAIEHMVRRVRSAPVRTALILGVGAVFALTVLVPARGWVATAQRQSAAASTRLVEGVRVLDARVVEAGISTVFQLPHVKYPEAAPVNGFRGYEHAWPIVLQPPNASTRWSFGHMEGQPMFHRLSVVVRRPPARMIEGLRCLGFEGVVVERRAYADGGAGERARLLSADSAAVPVFEDDTRMLFDIRGVPANACDALTRYSPGAVLSFKSGTDGDVPVEYFLAGGWFDPEPWGTWMNGARARVALPIGSVGVDDLILSATIAPFTGAGNRRPRGEIVVGGRTLDTWTFASGEPTTRRVRVPNEIATRGGGTLVVEFRTPDAVSPASIGLSVDGRRLGLGLIRVAVDRDGGNE